MNTSNQNGSWLSSLESGGVDLQSIMRQVYVWMGFGMLVTAGMAYFTVSTPLLKLASNPIILLVAVLAEFGLVMGISLGFNRISAS